MDPKEDQNQNQQDQDQQSLSDQGLTKKIAKKGLQSLRGIGVAGETAGAEAGAAATGAETATAAGVAEGLGAAAAEGAATTTATASAAAAEGALTGAAITSGSSFGMWALAITLIAVFIITIIVVITGGGSGVNLNSSSPNPEPGPGSKLPEIINFKGGHAYLSCSKTERINCPTSSLGDPVTIFAIFYIDDTFPASLKNTATITIGPFSPSYFDFLNFLNIKPFPDTHISPNYTWKLSTVLRSAEKGSDPNEYIISMGVGKPLKSGPTDVTLSLKGFQDVTGSGGDTGDLYVGATSLPTNDTCKGQYSGVMADLSKSWPEMKGNTNFADPVCSYRPDKFKQVLEATETKSENIPFWTDIMRTEGAIMTVGGLKDSSGKIIYHASGPFGKFQMGRSYPLPGKKWSSVDDRGDTTWQKQIENAVGYNKVLAQNNNNFGYWGTAMCLCYFDYYRNSNKGWCDDIIKAHQVRCPYACTGGLRCSKPTDNVGSDYGKREIISCNSPKMTQCSGYPGDKY